MQLIIFFAIPLISYSQIEKDDISVYSTVLSSSHYLKHPEKIDTIILLDKTTTDFANWEQNELWGIAEDPSNEIVYGFLNIATSRNIKFIERYYDELILRNSILAYAENIKLENTINTSLIEEFNVGSMTTKKYNSYFGKNNKRTTNGLKRLERRYGKYLVIEFSNVFYNENIAVVFFAVHCGGLCGSGDVVVLELHDGKWNVLTWLNCWKS